MPEQPDIAGQIVCVGFPVKGMHVRIVRDGSVQGPREIGAIELRGPTIAGSYLTLDGVFPLARHDGWFDSGDLGYLDEEGRIYVCGRTKDLIMAAGKNLYPHDIERAAENVDGVRKGCVIALRVEAEREGFAVLAEVPQRRRGGHVPADQPRHRSAGKPPSWARPARDTAVSRGNLAEDTVGQAAPGTARENCSPIFFFFFFTPLSTSPTVDL